MPTIIPSILEDSLAAFQDRLAEVLKIPEVKRIQVDFSDGKFTPHKTLAVADLELLNPAYFWEAHLMVGNPQQYFFDAQLAGFNNVVFHYEALRDSQKIKACVEELKSNKMSAGLAINPETAVEEIFEFIPWFEQILIMDIHPGYSGQELLPDTFERIKKLKNHQKSVKIEVDGGVKLANIKLLRAAGAELFIVNSALFEKGDQDLTPTQNFEKLSIELQNL